MPPPFLIPAATHRSELTISRSRFIATIAHSPTVEDARAFIDAMRVEFADATHNCWAYVAGPPGQTAFIGMSDAGEPHGTAGRPMLDVLLHSGIGEVVAVVTRYYGGTQLGKGGLVRAYGGAVQQALAELQTIEKIARAEITLAIPYTDVDAVRRAITEFGAELTAESYGADVEYTVAVAETTLDRFIAQITDRTAGRAHVGKR